MSRGVSLAQEIGLDLLQHKFQMVLALALLASAFAVILTTHFTRMQIAANEQQRMQRDRLNIEWRNLVLEQSALDEHSRVEQIAKKRLAMIRPTQEREKVVQLP